MIFEAGNEKARYVTGFGIAINDKGDWLTVELVSALKQLIQDQWMIDPATLTEASY